MCSIVLETYHLISHRTYDRKMNFFAVLRSFCHFNYLDLQLLKLSSNFKI